MAWLVAIIAVVGIAPVFFMMLWAFGQEIIILHKDELALRRRTVEREDRLFEQFMGDPKRKVISRVQAAALVAIGSAMAAWPFVLIGWAIAKQTGATIAVLPFVPASVYSYLQIRRLPRRVERARTLAGGSMQHA